MLGELEDTIMALQSRVLIGTETEKENTLNIYFEGYKNLYDRDRYTAAPS